MRKLELSRLIQSRIRENPTSEHWLIRRCKTAGFFYHKKYVEDTTLISILLDIEKSEEL